jgi:hypothetical protein
MISACSTTASNSMFAGKFGFAVMHIAIMQFLACRMARTDGFCLWIPGATHSIFVLTSVRKATHSIFVLTSVRKASKYPDVSLSSRRVVGNFPWDS